MKIVLISFYGVIGAIVGSFIDCASYRYSNNISLIKEKRSFCPNCKHRLANKDLIPIFSYILLKGRCRYCKSKIPIRHLVCELYTSFIYIIMFVFSKNSLSFCLGIIVISVLLFASLVDIDTKIVPDRCFVTIAVSWLCSIFFKETSFNDILNLIVGGLVIPGIIIFISYLINKRINAECIGGGDIKLLASIGLVFGGILNLFNVMLMSLLGVIYILIRKIGKGEKIAFVPFISLSTTLIYVFKDIIIKGYESLLLVV